MLPYIIFYNAVSLDGRIDYAGIDVAQYYRLAASWDEDCALAGSETILRSLEAQGTQPDSGDPPAPPAPDPADSRSLLVVSDSRGRLRHWQYLREAGHWRDVMALCSRSTPPSYLAYLEKWHVPYLIAGADRVDYRGALETLYARRGIRKVRVDSGGTLNGVLLRAGLGDEVNVLVYPALVGGTTPASIYRAADLESPAGAVPLELISSRRLKGGVVWLRYLIRR